MGEPDVSVVVVHGTGTQARGETLTEWVEDVLRFTDVQGRRGAPTEVTELAGQDAPAAATVAVGQPGSGHDPVVQDPAVRLRIVEAHWADAFTAPTPGDVLRWLLWFAPSFAVTQMVLEARGTVTPTTADAPPRGSARVRQLRPFAPVYAIALGLVGLALLGPVLVLAVLVLMVSAAVPAAGVRNVAATVLGYVSQNVGDVQSFLIRQVARARMEARVCRVVAAEVRRWGADRVHVLAASQGAALTHAALLRLPPENRPARLTTVGGAHGRLHDIRTLPPPAWTRVPIVLTGLVWLFAVPLLGALGVGGAAAVVLSVTVLAALSLAVAASRRLDAFAGRHDEGRQAGAPTAPLPSPGTVPGVAWLDMWASFDAVHNGRAVAWPGPAYRFVLVPGQMQVLGDHLSYGEDWTESVPRILRHLTGHLPEPARLGAPRGVRARADLEDPDGTGSNWTPWAGRDWVALALRVLPVAAAVLALVTPWREEYRQLGERVAGLHPIVSTLVDGATGLLNRSLHLFGPAEVSATGAVEAMLGLVLGLLLAALVGGAGTAMFRIATRTEATAWARSLDDPPVRRWSGTRWTVVGAVIVGLWAVLLAVVVAMVVAVD
ncbi:hypothetical protein PU560_04855 [Georgenia sp. 10Sc9-8]|uniref:Uncharacterized protein n=1 Tax=Georgenia halotolerans TaxID=3028317 RepID=A0ABT5TY50_9MICO|nr:hypothetical protein [Georgenia halotolerans]